MCCPDPPLRKDLLLHLLGGAIVTSLHLSAPAGTAWAAVSWPASMGGTLSWNGLYSVIDQWRFEVLAILIQLRTTLKGPYASELSIELLGLSWVRIRTQLLLPNPAFLSFLPPVLNLRVLLGKHFCTLNSALESASCRNQFETEKIGEQWRRGEKEGLSWFMWRRWTLYDPQEHKWIECVWLWSVTAGCALHGECLDRSCGVATHHLCLLHLEGDKKEGAQVGEGSSELLGAAQRSFSCLIFFQFFFL